MFYMTDDEIDKIFPVDDGWSDIDRGDAIGKRQGAKWMRDKLFGNVAKPERSEAHKLSYKMDGG